MEAKQTLIVRVNSLIELGKKTVSMKGMDGYSANRSRFRAQGLSFILSLNGNEHPNYTEFNKTSFYDGASFTKASVSILEGIKQEIENDYYLITIEGLITAEIFTDYLEMAEYLIS